MRLSFITASFLIGLGFATFSLHAQTVKKWVDEEGVTHYSDQQPVEGATEVEEVEAEEAPVTEFEGQEASERIKEYLDQVEQEREAREREAAEKEQAEALEEALEREPIVGEEKKKKKDKGGGYRGPYPKPLPGPFPKPPPGPFPKPPASTLPSGSDSPSGSNLPSQ